MDNKSFTFASEKSGWKDSSSSLVIVDSQSLQVSPFTHKAKGIDVNKKNRWQGDEHWVSSTFFSDYQRITKKTTMSSAAFIILAQTSIMLAKIT
ncbi:MAG: hypothetical protein OHK0038_22950 [Flammeovirgaceae bacterium]